MRLKFVAAALLFLGTLAGPATTVEARDGCGPGYHLSWSGWCRSNWHPYIARPVLYAAPVVVGYGWGRPWDRPWGHPRGWHRPWGWHHADWHEPWGWRYHW